MAKRKNKSQRFKDIDAKDDLLSAYRDSEKDEQPKPETNTKPHSDNVPKGESTWEDKV